MRAVHCVVIAAALFAASSAAAQQRLEDRLSATEFRAAGLDRLSAAELARLNEYVARDDASGDVASRLAEAREAGRREGREAQRGLRAATAPREPVTSTITGPFEGFARGREYTLADGQVWRQIDDTTISGARGHDVAVRIRPGLMGVWWLQVDGHNRQAKVERIR